MADIQCLRPGRCALSLSRTHRPASTQVVYMRVQTMTTSEHLNVVRWSTPIYVVDILGSTQLGFYFKAVISPQTQATS